MWGNLSTTLVISKGGSNLIQICPPTSRSPPKEIMGKVRRNKYK